MGYLHSGLGGADHGELAASQKLYKEKLATIAARNKAAMEKWAQENQDEAILEAARETAREEFWGLIEKDPKAALAQLRGIARNGKVPCVWDPYNNTNMEARNCPKSSRQLWEQSQHGVTYYPYWED